MRTITFMAGLTTMFALAQVSAAELTHAVEVSIRWNRGRVIIPARINSSEKSWSLLLDSACTIPTLRPELVDELGLQPSGRVRINGIAGIERAPTYRGVQFQLGEAVFSPRRVASLPSEREQSRRRDGVLGSEFFETFVVELRPRGGRMRLHPPGGFEYSGAGEIIPFRFHEEIPVVKAAIVLPGGSIEGEFEIDTGCDSGVCLGEHFIREHNLLEALEGRASEKFGVGGSVQTHSARLPLFRLGRMEIEQAQADLFLDGSPVDEPLAGHIGMAVLNRFAIFFDYARKRLIVEKPGPEK